MQRGDSNHFYEVLPDCPDSLVAFNIGSVKNNGVFVQTSETNNSHIINNSFVLGGERDVSRYNNANSFSDDTDSQGPIAVYSNNNSCGVGSHNQSVITGYLSSNENSLNKRVIVQRADHSNWAAGQDMQNPGTTSSYGGNTSLGVNSRRDRSGSGDNITYYGENVHHAGPNISNINSFAVDDPRAGSNNIRVDTHSTSNLPSHSNSSSSMEGEADSEEGIVLDDNER